MKHMKKVAAVLLAMMMAVSAGTVVFAEELEKNQEGDEAVSSVTKQDTEKPNDPVMQDLQKGPTQTYGITIDGEKVTSENAGDVFKDGTVSYDAEQQILTLNNATIEGKYAAQGMAAIMFSGGDFTIRLIGSNTITSDWFGVYSSNNTITIGGSGTLTVHADNDAVRAVNVVVGIANEGVPTIDVTGKERYASGIYATNTLTIQNGANVTAKSEAEGYALCGENGITIIGSTVNATVNKAETNAIASFANLSIQNSKVTAEATSKGAYPVLYGETGVDISNSIIQVVSPGDIGIYSPAAVQIQNTVAEVTAPNGIDSIRGNTGTNLSGSWIESIGGAVNENAVVTDSVIFLDQQGTVSGNAVVSGNVSIDQEKNLTVPDGSSLTVSQTGRLTNNGTIRVKTGGSLINEGVIDNQGKIIIEKGGTLEGDISGSGTVTNYNSSGGGSVVIPPATDSNWRQSPYGWWYQNPDGTYPANQWKYLETGKGYKAWYWFNANGYMTTGWQRIGNTWYYMNGAGEMQTGWLFAGGKWYYLNSSGAMVTGWVYNSGKWYFMNPNGSMHFGWLKWSGYWYHLDSHGVMSTGWKQVNGKWYYFYGENGRMAASTTTPDGYRVNANGEWIR